MSGRISASDTVEDTSDSDGCRLCPLDFLPAHCEDYHSVYASPKSEEEIRCVFDDS